MQTSDEERSNSVEIDEELPIQLDSISNFLMNMAFTLLATFKAREGQSPSIDGDVEEKEAPTAKIVGEKDEPK